MHNNGEPTCTPLVIPLMIIKITIIVIFSDLMILSGVASHRGANRQHILYYVTCSEKRDLTIATSNPIIIAEHAYTYSYIVLLPWCPVSLSHKHAIALIINFF